MYLWTVQSIEVIRIILEDGVYYPDCTKSKGYSEMKLTYPYLLKSFNSLNCSQYKGIIFGYYKVNNGNFFYSIDDLYKYLYEHYSVTKAFNFWSKNYAILQIKLDDTINIMPMDFNDTIKLSIKTTNDIPRIQRLYKSITDFKIDINNILTAMEKGEINSKTLTKSFIEGHYPYIKKCDILGIYPNFDLQLSKQKNMISTFTLPKEANELLNQLI